MSLSTRWAIRAKSLRILSIGEHLLRIKFTVTWTRRSWINNRTRGRTKSRQLSSVSWTRSNAVSLVSRNPPRKICHRCLKKICRIRILTRSGTNLISCYSCPTWSTSDRSPCEERPWVRITWFHAVRSAWENQTMKLREWTELIRRMIKVTTNIFRGFPDRALKRTSRIVFHLVESLERANTVLRTSLKTLSILQLHKDAKTIPFSVVRPNLCQKFTQTRTRIERTYTLFEEKKIKSVRADSVH